MTKNYILRGQLSPGDAQAVFRDENGNSVQKLSQAKKYSTLEDALIEAENLDLQAEQLCRAGKPTGIIWTVAPVNSKAGYYEAEEEN